MTEGWWLGMVYLAAGCSDTACNATTESVATSSSDFDTGVAGSTSGSTPTGIITLDRTGGTGAGGSGSVDVGCGAGWHTPARCLSHHDSRAEWFHRRSLLEWDLPMEWA